MFKTKHSASYAVQNKTKIRKSNKNFRKKYAYNEVGLFYTTTLFNTKTLTWENIFGGA